MLSHYEKKCEHCQNTCIFQVEEKNRKIQISPATRQLHYSIRACVSIVRIHLYFLSERKMAGKFQLFSYAAAEPFQNE